MLNLMKIALATVLLVSIGYSQRCGTEAPNRFGPDEIQFTRKSNERLKSNKTTQVVRIIPIAVHVIFETPSSPSNISDSQIESQIQILNDDFRGISGGADTEIEFCLAGVNRIQDPVLFSVDLNSNVNDAKALSQEPPDSFLNIWIVDILRRGPTAVLGSARFPADFPIDPQLDGLIIADEAFGNIGTAIGNTPFHLGRTATHEIGHWLNVFHPWCEAGNPCTRNGGCDDRWTCEEWGDCCCDTPPQISPSYGCNVGENTCTTDNPDLPNAIRNYMNYSDDACMNNFTACQSSRMNVTLDDLRPDVWFTGNDCRIFKTISRQFPIQELSLKAYPNPTNGETTIRLNLPEGSLVSIHIISATGSIIKTIVDSKLLSSGEHQFAVELPPTLGLYLIRCETLSGSKNFRLVNALQSK